MRDTLANWIALEGDWDINQKDDLSALVNSLVPDRPAVIDLRECTYADSTVLGVLAALRLRFGDVPITLLGPQRQILRILQVVGFDKLFDVVED